MFCNKPLSLENRESSINKDHLFISLFVSYHQTDTKMIPSAQFCTTMHLEKLLKNEHLRRNIMLFFVL